MSGDFIGCPEKLGFGWYTQEFQFGKGLNLVVQYLSEVCGKNYLDNSSVKGKCGLKRKADVSGCHFDVKAISLDVPKN